MRCSLPEPANVTEGWIFQIYVGDSVNRDELIEDLESYLRPESFVLTERATHFSWGADASGLKIIIRWMNCAPAE